MIDPLGPPAGPPATHDTRRLQAVARDLEASFLTEMLRSAGAERQPGFGTADRDSPFASFLLEARAREMVQAGGLGLAQTLFDALVAADDTR